MKQMNFPGRKAKRHEEALVRNKLTPLNRTKTYRKTGLEKQAIPAKKRS